MARAQRTPTPSQTRDAGDRHPYHSRASPRKVVARRAVASHARRTACDVGGTIQTYADGVRHQPSETMLRDSLPSRKDGPFLLSLAFYGSCPADCSYLYWY